jgi:PHD/YefM family antitoxin component YafN of YafNO toxin-antitoxin module
MPGKPKRRRSRETAAPPEAESGARPAPNAAKSFSSMSAEVPMIVIPSTVVQNEFGRVFDRAMAGTDVAIAKHNVVRAFLVSAERYQELVRQQTVDLDALSSRFEQLYARMQTPEARAATDRALSARPKDMGKAAVAAVRRSRQPPAGKARNR